MDRRRADRATGCLAAASAAPAASAPATAPTFTSPPPPLHPGGARGWTGTQATRQWHGTGAPGDEDSDIESLAHNIQIGAPRCQIRQGSPSARSADLLRQGLPPTAPIGDGLCTPIPA